MSTWIGFLRSSGRPVPGFLGFDGIAEHPARTRGARQPDVRFRLSVISLAALQDILLEARRIAMPRFLHLL
jgi:hypothetical protein